METDDETSQPSARHIFDTLVTIAYNVRDLVLYATKIEKAPAPQHWWQFQDSRPQSTRVSYLASLRVEVDKVIKEMKEFGVSQLMVAMAVYKWVESLYCHCGNPPAGAASPAIGKNLDRRIVMYQR